jgi:hypothetical protein
VYVTTSRKTSTETALNLLGKFNSVLSRAKRLREALSKFTFDQKKFIVQKTALSCVRNTAADLTAVSTCVGNSAGRLE